MVGKGGKTGKKEVREGELCEEEKKGEVQWRKKDCMREKPRRLAKTGYEEVTERRSRKKRRRREGMRRPGFADLRDCEIYSSVFLHLPRPLDPTPISIETTLPGC